MIGPQNNPMQVPFPGVLPRCPEYPQPALRAGKRGQGSAPHPAQFYAERTPLRGSRRSLNIATSGQVQGMGEPLAFGQLSLEM